MVSLRNSNPLLAASSPWRAFDSTAATIARLREAVLLARDFFAADFLMADFRLADFRTLDFRRLDLRVTALLVPRFRLAGFAFFFADMRISDSGVSRRRSTEMGVAAGREQGGPPPPSAP